MTIETIADLQARCERCGWPLADSIEKGCVPGNCSCRCYRSDAFCECVQRGRRLAALAMADAEFDSWFQVAAGSTWGRCCCRQSTGCAHKIPCGESGSDWCSTSLDFLGSPAPTNQHTGWRKLPQRESSWSQGSPRRKHIRSRPIVRAGSGHKRAEYW